MTEIKVSQRAREAAAQTAEECGKPSVAKHIRAGAADQNWRVQAFARFEQAVRADERERAVEAIPALVRPFSNDPEAIGYYDGVQECLEAIRAQGGEA